MAHRLSHPVGRGEGRPGHDGGPGDEAARLGPLRPGQGCFIGFEVVAIGALGARITTGGATTWPRPRSGRCWAWPVRTGPSGSPRSTSAATAGGDGGRSPDV